MSVTHPILIVGAGLSGLSLARSLKARGIASIVFDAIPADRRQGYGITLRSWSFKVLLDHLRADVGAFREATAVDASVGGNGAVGNTLLDAQTGNALVTASPISNIEQHSFRANRWRLREWLRNGVDVRFDHEFTSVVKSEDGSVTAHFKNGKQAQGALLVGADGVHSTVRNSYLPSTKPSILSTVVINGQRRVPHSTFVTNFAPYFRDSNITIGCADNVTLGVSINRVTPEHADISWTYSRPARDKEDPLFFPNRSLDEARTIPSAFFKELQSLGELSSLFAQIYNPETVRVDKMYNWLMRSVRIPRSQLESAVKEHGIALIGDSAHAMPILGGEGGNHALQDGLEEGNAIADAEDPSMSILNFYQKAYERWQSGIDSSEIRLSDLHRPLATWRTVATSSW